MTWNGFGIVDRERVNVNCSRIYSARAPAALSHPVRRRRDTRSLLAELLTYSLTTKYLSLPVSDLNNQPQPLILRNTF